MRKHQQTIQQIPKLRLFSLLHVFVATLGEGQNEAEVYFRCCNQLQLLLKVDPSAKLHFSKDRKKAQKVPGNLRNTETRSGGHLGIDTHQTPELKHLHCH